MTHFYRAITALLICLTSTTITAASWIPSYLPYTLELGLGYDYFRSLPEGDWEGNIGGLLSANTTFTDDCLWQNYGIAAQLGGSYGLYDWTGRGSSPSNTQSDIQQQAFITAAIFHNTFCCSGFNFGLAYDWMWNKNASVFACTYDISQLRFQGGYQYDLCNEYGIWATLDVHTSHPHSEGIPLAYRAINQINVYWMHRFENCAKTMIWIGTPYKKSLMFSGGRAGKFLIGGQFHVPLTCQFSIDGHASYMAGHSAAGNASTPPGLRQRNYAANICIELKWFFDPQETCLEPYMSIGNNSNFIADTNLTF